MQHLETQLFVMWSEQGKMEDLMIAQWPKDTGA